MSTTLKPARRVRDLGRPWKDFQTSTRWKVAGIVVLLVLIALGPSLLPASELGIADLAIPAAIGALGLNLLTGYSGQVSLGQAAFLAVGAFTAVFFEHAWHLSMWLGVPAGGVVACIVGLLVGAPSLRFRGFYLVLTTLGLQYVVVYVLQYYEVKYGGGAGFPLNPQYFAGIAIDSDTKWYYVLASFGVIVTIICWNLVHSATGRAWVAVRDRDIAAAITGVDVNRMKLRAFGASSFFAGISGALVAYYTAYVGIESYTLTLAIQYVAMIIVGGLGSITGSIIGAVVITALPVWIGNLVNALPSTTPLLTTLQSSIYYVEYAAYGLVIVVMLIVEPRGLVAVPQRLYRAVARMLPARAGAQARPDAAGHLPEAQASAPAVSLAAADERPAEAGVVAGSPAAAARDQRPDRASLALEVSDLMVLYDGVEKVLDRVSLEVPESHVVVVLGANGAGKTSLLRAISGFQPVEHAKIISGSVKDHGVALNRMTPDAIARRGIIHVPEREKVFRSLTVEQNLRLARTRSAGKKDADWVLELFPRLTERMTSPAALLSCGERQMLALAVALLMKPKLLLIDELSLGLAPTVASSLYSTIRTIRESSQISMLIVEQDATSALDYADYVYVLAQGDFVLQGTPATLRSNPELMTAYFGIGETPEPQTSATPIVQEG